MFMFIHQMVLILFRLSLYQCFLGTAIVTIGRLIQYMTMMLISAVHWINRSTQGAHAPCFCQFFLKVPSIDLNIQQNHSGGQTPFLQILELPLLVLYLFTKGYAIYFDYSCNTCGSTVTPRKRRRPNIKGRGPV